MNFGCTLAIPFCVTKVQGIDHKIVFLFQWCLFFFAISANYAIDDIDGGTHEVISNLNRSFGSWYFLNILNERTSFASCLHAFESSSWSIVCIYLLAIELPMLCSTSLEIILKLFKFLRMVDLTIWLRCWNVRVNGIPSVFPFVTFT